jgi:xanthine dehydrogenase accessory factor
MKKIFQTLADWHQGGARVALATVIRTWGSAPRRAGSLMAIAADGRCEGSGSGGCVEGTVIAEAQALMAGHAGTDSASRLLSFTVASEDAWQVGLACGGQIEIQVTVLSGDVRAAAASVIAALDARKPATLTVMLADGALTLSYGAAAETLALGTTTLRLPVLPRRRLMVIGAVHIAQHLALMAQETGYDVTIIDPRAAFTENRQFGDAALVTDWPDEFFRTTRPDRHTAVVALTHDPKIDDAALMPALKSDCFYIGALGSRKTQAARLSRLAATGADDAALGRIHGPVGLDIGAANPAEIAVAILAQITRTLRHSDAV